MSKTSLSDLVCHAELKIVDAGLLMGKKIKDVEQSSNLINIRCTDGSVFCIESFSNCEIACQKVQG